MRITRWFVLLALVAFTVSTAMADGFDPKFTLKGGCCSIPITDGSLNFDITPAQVTDDVDTTPDSNDGEFTIDFVNRSFDATSLVLTIFGLPTTMVYTCDPTAGGNYFTTCSFNANEDGTTTLSFFGTDETHPGILTQHCSGDADADDECSGPPQSDFIIDVTSIPDNLRIINVSGSLSLPEPPTGFSLLIGLVGLAGLAAWQKLRGAKATA